MPNPLTERAGRARGRSRSRRLLDLLALTAVALPLIALSPVSAGVGDGPTSSAPSSAPTSAPIRTVPAAPVMQVVALIDGSAVHFRVTDARTVVEALRAFDVDRSPLDRIEPALDTPIDGPVTIRITRVELDERRVEVELPREVVRLEDPALPLGQVRVDRRGSTGLRIDTQLILTVDGEVESKLTLEQATVRTPVARVERVGTMLREGETVWDALARCEAGGRWDAVRRVNSRTEYHGGLQFHTRTWTAYRAADFPGLASEATREQQIVVGERVLAAQGWGAWPSCSRRLGLR